MYKKTRKAMALSLAAMMAATTMFAGCGSSNDSKKDNKQDSKQNSSSGSSKKAEEVTLTFPVWDLASTPYLNDIVDGFEAKHENIKINIVDIAASEYVSKLSTMLNGGADCDIVYIKDPDGTPSFADKGQLEDLTSYVEADSLDIAKFVGYDDFNLDKKQAALPFKTDYYVLYYNKDIFDAANVAYPSNDMTWSDWEEMSEKLTSGEGADKIYGGYLHTWQACVQNWAVQDGKHTILDTDYSFMKPAYEMALRMQEAGTTMDYSTLKTGNIAYASPFQQGTVATLPMGTWFSSTMIAKVNAGETDVNWGIATLPHPDGVEAGNTIGSTTPMGVNANSKHKEEAWEFIKYACGEEGSQKLIANGQMPAYQDEKTLDSLAALDGMPEGAAEAMATKSIVFDRPIDSNSAEVNQMLSEEHSLIMIGEKSIDDVLAEMGTRSEEIQGK